MVTEDGIEGEGADDVRLVMMDVVSKISIHWKYRSFDMSYRMWFALRSLGSGCFSYYANIARKPRCIKYRNRAYIGCFFVCRCPIKVDSQTNITLLVTGIRYTLH